MGTVSYNRIRQTWIPVQKLNSATANWTEEEKAGEIRLKKEAKITSRVLVRGKSISMSYCGRAVLLCQELSSIGKDYTSTGAEWLPCLGRSNQAMCLRHGCPVAWPTK